MEMDQSTPQNNSVPQTDDSNTSNHHSETVCIDMVVDPSWQLVSALNEALRQTAVLSAREHRYQQTVQSLITGVLLKVLDWSGIRWSELRDLTRQCLYVHPDIANRLSHLCISGNVAPMDDSTLVILNQQLIRPEKLAKILSTYINSTTKPNQKESPLICNFTLPHPLPKTLCLGSGGSMADELDAILAVDGLATKPPLPNFETKRYLENCRFAIDEKQRAHIFEKNTLEDDDQRVHVHAVRKVYSQIPVRLLRYHSKQKHSHSEETLFTERIAYKMVYKTIREVFKNVGVELPPLPSDEDETNCEENNDNDQLSVSATKFEAELLPKLTFTYMSMVGNERLKRIAFVHQLESKKPDKRGRKRKVVDDSNDDSNENVKTDQNNGTCSIDVDMSDNNNESGEN